MKFITLIVNKVNNTNEFNVLRDTATGKFVALCEPLQGLSQGNPIAADGGNVYTTGILLEFGDVTANHMTNDWILE